MHFKNTPVHVDKVFWRVVNLLNSLVLQGRYRAPHRADSNFTVAGGDELVNGDDWWQDRAEECLLISFQKVQVNIISLSENAGSATVKYKVGRDAIICSTHTRTDTCKYTQLQAVSVTSRLPNDKQGSYFQQTVKRNETPDFDCVSVYALQTRLWHFNGNSTHVFLCVCVLVS